MYMAWQDGKAEIGSVLTDVALGSGTLLEGRDVWTQQWIRPAKWTKC